MNKQELLKQMNDLCEKAKIQDEDIETILKIRQIKAKQNSKINNK